MFCRDSARFFSEAGNVTIPPPAQKTFDAEGESLGTCFDEILAPPETGDQKPVLIGTPFRDATIKEECKRDYPHVLQALWKALDRAEDLIKN
jgi:hypothetical protein